MTQQWHKKSGRNDNNQPAITATSVTLGNTKFGVKADGELLPISVVDKTSEFLKWQKANYGRKRAEILVYQITPLVSQKFAFDKVVLTSLKRSKIIPAPISGLKRINAFKNEAWQFAMSGSYLPPQAMIGKLAIAEYYFVANGRTKPMTFVVAAAKKPTMMVGQTTMQASELPTYATLIEAVKWTVPLKDDDTPNVVIRKSDIENLQNKTALNSPFNQFRHLENGERQSSVTEKTSTQSPLNNAAIHNHSVSSQKVPKPSLIKRILARLSANVGESVEELTLPFGTFYIEADGKRVPFEVEETTKCCQKKTSSEHPQVFRAFVLILQLPSEYSFKKLGLKTTATELLNNFDDECEYNYDDNDIDCFEGGFWDYKNYCIGLSGQINDDYCDVILGEKSLPCYCDVDSKHSNKLLFTIAYRPKVGLDWLEGLDEESLEDTFWNTDSSCFKKPGRHSFALIPSKAAAHVVYDATRALSSPLGRWTIKAKVKDGNFVDVPFSLIEFTKRTNTLIQENYVNAGRVEKAVMLVPLVSKINEFDSLHLCVDGDVEYYRPWNDIYEQYGHMGDDDDINATLVSDGKRLAAVGTIGRNGYYINSEEKDVVMLGNSKQVVAYTDCSLTDRAFVLVYKSKKEYDTLNKEIASRKFSKYETIYSRDMSLSEALGGAIELFLKKKGEADEK